ncbi:hypothetical protein [Azospirillum sp. sgz302134]
MSADDKTPDNKTPHSDPGLPASEDERRNAPTGSPTGSVDNPSPRTGGGGIDPAALGGPATPAIGQDGAQAGGGPQVGATEGGTRGVLGLGTSATAGSAPGSDDRDRPQPQPGGPDRMPDRNVAVDGGRDNA